ARRAAGRKAGRDRARERKPAGAGADLPALAFPPGQRVSKSSGGCLELRNSFAVAEREGSGRRRVVAQRPLEPSDRAVTVPRVNAMSLLKWAFVFLVISLVAALFGFTGISAASADIARVLFYIFVIIF